MTLAAPAVVRALTSDAPVVIVGWNASAGATSYNLWIDSSLHESNDVTTDAKLQWIAIKICGFV